MANIKAGVAYVDVRLGSIEKLKREIEEKIEKVGSDAGEKLTDGMGKTTEETITKKVTEKIKTKVERSGSDSGKGFGENFGEGVARSSQIIRSSALAYIVPVLVALGPFIGASFGAAIIAGLPLAGIGLAIAGLVNDQRIIKAAQNLKDKFGKALTDAAMPLRQSFIDAMGSIVKQLPSIMTPIKSIFASVKPFIQPLTDTLVTSIKNVLEGVSTAIKNSQPIFDVFRDGLERFTKAFGDFLTKISSDPEAVKGMSLALQDLFTVLVLVIEWFGNFIVSASRAYAQFKEAWQKIKDWFSGTIVPSLKRAVDQLVAIFDGFINWIKGMWQKLTDGWRKAHTSIQGTLTLMKNTVTTTAANIVNTFTQLPGKILNALSTLSARLYSAGKNAIQGFINGLGDMAGAVFAKAQGIANTVINTIKGALQIHSPSRVMMKLGKFTGQGFAMGLNSSMPSLAIPGVPSTPLFDNSFGDIKNPQMDRPAGGSGLHIDNYYANDNVDPWRQAEDWYFMVSARGGVA